MWNAELEFYYGKRFKIDSSDKPQSMLSEGKGSRIICLNDREEACFRLVFEDETREPQDILMADFIDDKSPKAKGKRFTTLPLATIEDITPEPEPEPEEPEFEEPEQGGSDESGNASDDNASSDTTEATLTTEVSGVTLTITNQIPEDSKPQDEQLSLF